MNKNTEATRPIRDSALDDRELMRWLDGELDDEARAAFEQQLDEDDEALAKLEGLDTVGSVLRELVEGDTRADSIADAVMAEIEQLGGDDSAKSEGSEPEQAARELFLQSAPAGQAANDNARTIYAAAALAAAVAAGLFFWSKGEPDLVSQAPSQPPAIEAPAEAPAQPPPSPTPEAAIEREPDPGVEIAAVDFGSQSGSVFYISGGGTSTSSTAVVWVTEGE